jgi:hypothetical protein
VRGTWRYALALAAFAAPAATGAFAQSASNVTLVGTHDTPGRAGGVHVATAASATYAYVADGEQGMRILDVTDRAAPREVGALPAPNSCPATGAHPDCGPASVTSFAASGSVLFRTDSKIAYCTNQGCITNPENGLRVFDTSNPTSPVEIGFLHTAGRASQVTLGGRYAYLSDDTGGFRVIDVSDPTRPIQVFDDPSQGANAVAVAGNLAYVVATTGADMLVVYDVRDPTRPTRVGGAGHASGAFFVVPEGGIALVGRYALVAGGSQNLLVYDVGDPTRPTAVANVRTAVPVSDVEVVGSYAYVAASTGGLRVFSIADPTAPVEVGFYDTPGHAGRITLDGPDAFVGDGEAGLQILRFTAGPGTSPVRAYLPAVLNTGRWS